jgi:hypothetical protein
VQGSRNGAVWNCTWSRQCPKGNNLNPYVKTLESMDFREGNVMKLLDGQGILQHLQSMADHKFTSGYGCDWAAKYKVSVLFRDAGFTDEHIHVLTSTASVSFGGSDGAVRMNKLIELAEANPSPLLLRLIAMMTSLEKSLPSALELKYAQGGRVFIADAREGSDGADTYCLVESDRDVTPTVNIMDKSSWYHTDRVCFLSRATFLRECAAHNIDPHDRVTIWCPKAEGHRSRKDTRAFGKVLDWRPISEVSQAQLLEILIGARVENRECPKLLELAEKNFAENNRKGPDGLNAAMTEFSD